MANPIRIRRRNSGAVGAPTTLVNAELAFNEMDSTLYYGNGTDANGAATSILAIAGSGAFTTLTSAQTISGNKTFSGNLIAVTQNSTDSSTKVATTAFVANKLVNLANVVNSFNNRTGNVSLTLADVDAVAYAQYVPRSDDNNISIYTSDSTNQSQLDLRNCGIACLTTFKSGVPSAKLELVGSNDGNAIARLTGIGAWEANSILIRSYADARYLPVNGTGTIANLTVTGSLTALTQSNAVSNNLVATTDYVSNRLISFQTTANGVYVPISSGNTSTVTSTDGFNLSRLTLNGTTPAACLTSTNSSGTSLSLLLDPPTGQVTLTGMTSWTANSVLTRSYADSRYIQSTTNGSVSDLTVGGDLVVTGNVTVNGNTTTLNSVTLTIDDKNIELGSVASPSNTTANGGGLTLKGTTDKSLIWYDATNAWTSSENLTLVTGKTYQINGVNVLTSTALGSTVVSSSLTSVGTISTGVWQGSAVGVAYGGTGATTLTGYVKGSGTGALTACTTILGTDISGNITGNATNVTGIVAVVNGGTGANTATAARTNLLAAASGSNTDITSLGGLTTALSVAQGGTGVNTLLLNGYIRGNGTAGVTACTTIPGSAISGNITGSAANVTGIVAIANGGTGATTNGDALIALNAAARGVNNDITRMTGLTTAFGVAQGGTGATTLTGYVKGNGTAVMTACTTILGSEISGNITGSAAGLTGTLAVAFGGTGATTLPVGTYLRGNGTNSVASYATIPVGDLFGTVPVGSGGTGATTLTGYVKGSGTGALTACTTILGSEISGNITGNAAGLTGTLAVGFGGTGVTTLTSGAYLKGNGTGAITSASSTVPVTDVSGILTVAQGGTGVNTLLLNGYIRGNGTAGVTASLTIPGSAISGDITANATNVTGIVAIANGGTGATTNTAARTNLLAATRGANSDITSLTGLTTALSVAQGGTGATTLTGIIKGNGVGAFTAATEGTDFLSASSTIDGGTF